LGDAPDAELNPRKLVRKEILLDRQSGIEFNIAAGGGFTAILKPSEN